jgi:ubiquitin-conjugating enzyme E2 H
VQLDITQKQEGADVRTEYVQKFASKDAAEDSDKDNDDDDEMSSVGSYESGDEDEAAGNMEDI